MNNLGGSKNSYHRKCNTSDTANNRPVHQFHQDDQSAVNFTYNHCQLIQSYFHNNNMPDGIEIIADQFVFFCTSCNFKIDNLTAVEKHVKSVGHYASGKTYIVKIENEFACLICSRLLKTFDSLRAHLSSEIHRKCKVKNTLNPVNRMVQLLKSVRIHEHNKFSCSACRVQIKGNITVPLKHTLSQSHQLIMKKNEEKTSTTASQLYTRGPLPLKQHSELAHELVKEKSLTTIQPTSFLQINKSASTVPSSTIRQDAVKLCLPNPSQRQELPGPRHAISDYLIYDRKNTTINGSVHQNNVMMNQQPETKPSNSTWKLIESYFLKKNLPDAIETIPDELVFFCTLCNCRLDSLTAAEEHVNVVFHKARGKNFIFKISEEFACLICSNLLPNLKSLEKHLHSQFHQKKCKAMTQLNPINVMTKLMEPIKALEQDEYSCSTCHIRMQATVDSPLKHTLSERHQSILFNQKLHRRQEANGEKSTTYPKLICNFKVSDNNSTSEDIPRSPKSIKSEKALEVVLPINKTRSVCHICNLVIPGGDWNLIAHRNTKQHKTNEAELSVSLSTSSEQPSATQIDKSEVSNDDLLKNIPIEEIMQIHFNGMITDFIECKVCKIHIRAGEGVSVHQKYADHMVSQEHQKKEVNFIHNWSSANQTSNASMRSKDTQILSCPFCNEKMTCVDQFHSHLANHYWPKFITNFHPLVPGNDNPNGQNQRNWQRKVADVDLEDGVNIYEVHKQKEQSIRMGVLLTVAIDQERLYCMVCQKTFENTTQIFYDHLCSIAHLDYLQLMVQKHWTSKISTDGISDFALAYEHMVKMDNHIVNCHTCHISVPHNTHSLSTHILDESHLNKRCAHNEKANSWLTTLSANMRCDFYSVNNYWCVPCQSQFSMEIEFRKHLKSEYHLKQIEKFKNVDEEMIFDSCTACGGLWYGFLKTFGYHSNCAVHKHYASQNFYSITRLPTSAEQLLQFPQDTADQLLKQIDNVRAQNTEKERMVIHDLETIGREEYPNCIAHPFGSRVTALGGTGSDFDLFLDCSTKKYPVYDGNNSPRYVVQKRLKMILLNLQRHHKVWTIDREIVNARTPIIKARHLATEIECDISFTNGLAVESTKLIKRYCEKFPNCRKMIVFVKNWISHCQLTGFSGIASCAVTWMVIFFLQLKGILPSVHELIDKKSQSRLIGGWETAVNPDFEVFNIGEPIGKLLAGFFAFYADFDYRNEVICPLLGRSVKKTDFEKKVGLPIEMESYIRYIKNSEDPELFRIDSVMCVQDPFDLSHNITKAAKKIVVYRLKSFCSLSVQILQNYY